MVMDRVDGLRVREHVETVLGRAEFLDEADRVLLEQVLDRGVKPRDLAVLSEVSTRTVQRRVRGLMRRLGDPRVVFILREHRKWERAVASVALAVWVRGWTLRATSASLGLSLHRVRQHAAAARVLVDQARPAWDGRGRAGREGCEGGGRRAGPGGWGGRAAR